jgi:hypothetical protein
VDEVAGVEEVGTLVPPKNDDIVDNFGVSEYVGQEKSCRLKEVNEALPTGLTRPLLPKIFNTSGFEKVTGGVRFVAKIADFTPRYYARGNSQK